MVAKFDELPPSNAELPETATVWLTPGIVRDIHRCMGAAMSVVSGTRHARNLDSGLVPPTGGPTQRVGGE